MRRANRLPASQSQSSRFKPTQSACNCGHEKKANEADGSTPTNRTSNGAAATGLALFHRLRPLGRPDMAPDASSPRPSCFREPIPGVQPGSGWSGISPYIDDIVLKLLRWPRTKALPRLEDRISIPLQPNSQTHGPGAPTRAVFNIRQQASQCTHAQLSSPCWEAGLG